MFRSIKSRLTITICGILIFVFSIQMAANFLLAEQYYIFQKKKMLIDVYRQIVVQLQTSDHGIEDIITSLDVDMNLEFYLADENKMLIYHNRDFQPIRGGVEPPNPMAFDFSKYPDDMFQLSGPTFLKTDRVNGDRLSLLCKLEKDSSTYYIAIRLPIKSISVDMQSTNLFILYISSFAIIVGALMVYIIVKQFAKPIEDINHQ